MAIEPGRQFAPDRPSSLTASEIISRYNLEDIGGSSQQTPEKINDYMGAAYKRASEPERDGTSLVDKIKEKGFDKNSPLTISHYPDYSALTNGHHRLSIMLKDFPDEPIPLEHRG